MSFKPTRRGLVRLAILFALASKPMPSSIGGESTCDVLVVAPHSDDEAIGCTAVILRAVAEGGRVAVVVVTAGDAHVRCAAVHAGKPVEQLTPDDYVNLAALRQRHTLEAMPKIGVRTDDVLFLGYPDGGLAPMYQAVEQTPFQHPYTKRTETYGVVVADYHTRVHGRAAPYLKSSLAADLTEILRERKPQAVYTTDAADTHRDHSILSAYVSESAAVADYRGKLYTFVVHGKPPSRPPDLRLTLTQDEREQKRATLRLYQAGVSPIHDYLAEEYAGLEELFWQRSFDR